MSILLYARDFEIGMKTLREKLQEMTPEQLERIGERALTVQERIMRDLDLSYEEYQELTKPVAE